MQSRLVYMYLLNVPSVSSGYFNKIKRTSHLGKWPALSLEIFIRRVNVLKKIFMFVSKMWVARDGIHNMFGKTAKREDPVIWICIVCLGLFVQNFRTYAVLYIQLHYSPPLTGFA